MANCKKYTRAACGHLFKHYERAKDENGEYIKFGNQDIDMSRTYLNYNLSPIQANGQGGFIKERCSEVKMQNRKDVNVMCSWVVTAPKGLKKEETSQFFSETYKFLSERYGRDNIVSAYVHMDEVTPHIHFTFVPVIKDKKKDILKVSAKEVIDRKELQVFHKDLSAHMEKVFGRDVGIENEATKEGNKTVDELKRRTAKKEYDELLQQTEKIKKESEDKEREVREADERVKTLKKEEKDLKNEIKELEKIFKGKKLAVEDLEKIQPVKGLFGRVKNVKVSDVEKLKRMAGVTLQERKALNVAKQEVERLTAENAGLQKKIPTMAQKMKRNQTIIDLKEVSKELVDDYNGLLARYDKLVGAVHQLPKEEIEFISKKVNTSEEPNENKRRRSHDLEM